MDRERQVLLVQTHEFEIVSLGGGREHMDLPESQAVAQQKIRQEDQQFQIDKKR